MLKEILLVYTCDVWHTHDSMSLIAVANDIDDAISLIRNAGHELLKEDVEQLHSMKQTQGYNGNGGEFYLREITVGSLI